MEDVTREYLDAVNKLVDNSKPIEPKIMPLSDEIVWLDYMMALARNAELVEHSIEEDADLADEFLYDSLACYLLVEGNKDVKLYGKFINHNNVIIFI